MVPLPTLPDGAREASAPVAGGKRQAGKIASYVDDLVCLCLHWAENVPLYFY